MSFFVGCIVYWTPIPRGIGKEWRVIELWTDSEPKRLLLAEPEGTEMKCYVALAVDCEFVREGVPPKRVTLTQKTGQAPDIWKVPANCMLAEDR